LKKRRFFLSLRTRLLLLLALIMGVTQAISIYWVWHESQEQLIELVKLAQNPSHSREELRKEEKETMEALFIPTFVQGGLGLLVAGLAISWLMRPLARLAQGLDERSPNNLQPIQLEHASSELTVVTHALNDLLGRLAYALQRERQFTADVAHELRTPLAGIRLNLELMEQSGVAGISPLLERLDGLHRTVEQLLAMARLEYKYLSGVTGSLHMVEDVMSPLQGEIEELFAARKLQLQTRIQLDTFPAEAALVRMLLRNLLENCSRYADENSTVLLTLKPVELLVDGEHRAYAELSVQDQGPGVDMAKLEMLTSVFTRLDSRGSGVGLGLNIVSRVCDLHRARLSFANCDSPRGLCVTVCFPLEKQ